MWLQLVCYVFIVLTHVVLHHRLSEVKEMSKFMTAYFEQVNRSYDAPLVVSAGP